MEVFDVATGQLNQSGDVMAWGIIMAVFAVIGMLFLVLAEPGANGYQTFGREVLNALGTDTVEAVESEARRAA